MKGEKFFFQSFPAILDSDLAEQILPRPNLASSFINGVVAEVIQTHDERRFQHSLLTVIADYDYVESYYDILEALIGMIVDFRFANSDSLTEIGSVADISLRVREAYLSIHRMLEVKRSLSEVISNPFEFAIDAMFPAVVEDDGKLFYIHPLAWGLLKRWKLVRSDKSEQKEILLHLIRLLQLSENSSGMKLYIDKSSDYFQRLGVDKHKFTRSVFQLGNAIRLLKTMRRTWTTSWQPSASERPSSYA